MEFPGVLVLGLKSFEGCTRVIDFCGVSGVKLFFLEFPGIKSKTLKLQWGFSRKNVLNPPFVFFSGKGNLMKT